MAARSVATKYLLLTIIVLCSIYWFQRLSRQSINVITEDWRTELTTQNGKSVAEEIPSVKLQGPSSPHNEGLQNNLPEHASSPLLPEGYTAAFPRHIWQTSSEAGRVRYANQSQTWKNTKGFAYHWLSDTEADDFVEQTFAKSRPSLLRFWNELSGRSEHQPVRQKNQSSAHTDPTAVVDSTASSSIVPRADLLRYMLMFANGGVYADIDTSTLLHVDRWIPEQLGAQMINAIIGIEYDDTTYKMFVRPISFCQWTLMSKPGHQIFERAMNRVVSNLEFLARRQKISSLSQLKLDKLDVLEATGPGMISDVVLEVIQDQLPDQNITWETFHDQREGKLFGDVLILPINAFAGNQKHSHAGNPNYGEKLVQHHFGRSWYQPEKAKIT